MDSLFCKFQTCNISPGNIHLTIHNFVFDDLNHTGIQIFVSFVLHLLWQILAWQLIFIVVPVLLVKSLRDHVLLNTTAGIKRTSLSARSRAVRISSFGWRHKLSAATQTRLSTIIIEELVCRRSLSLHFFKSLVVLVLKIVAIEIVFLAFLVLPVLLVLLVLLVLFAVLAELIILNLPLFVRILVLVSKLTLFRCILLELIARRNEALWLLWRFSFSSFLIIVVAGGSLWEIPLIFCKLLLHFLQIKVLPV